MKSANIADIKNNFSHFIALVEQGEVIQVCKRNVPVAKFVPASLATRKNQTKLGCGIVGDITEPAMSEEDWQMFEE